MKKTLTTILALCVLFALCTTGALAESAKEDIVEGPKMNLVVATTLNPGSNESISLQRMLDYLSERTGGNVTGTLYEGGTLGSEVEMIEQVINGSIHISLTGTSATNKYAPMYDVFCVPYLFANTDEFLTVFNGKVGEALRAEILSHGFHFEYPIFRGNRQMTANKRIETPEDLKGLKLRLPETQSIMDVWASMGTLPTPITSSEVFGALQTGVVDAQENSIASNYNKGLWEVQKYTILTNHLVDYYAIMFGSVWFDNMSPEYQDLFREAMQDAADYCTKLTFESEADKRAEMEAHGMEFVEVDVEPFKEAAAAGVQKLAEAWEPWVYEEVQSELSAMK